MSTASGAPGPRGASKLSQLLDLVRSFPSQAKLALGVRGVAWATAAGLIGLIACVTSFADIMLSLHSSDVEHKRREASEILTLDNTNRLLMRTILGMSSGRVEVPTGEYPARDSWLKFQESLTSVCRVVDPGSPHGQRLKQVCDGRVRFFERVTPEVQAFDPPRRMLEPSTVRDLLAIRDDINTLAIDVAKEADTMIGHLIDDYGLALLVLTLSTTGFIGAGLVLILLVGRASVDHHRQWRDAQEARDLLQETLEALPAGVVVYTPDERLVLFNSVAASVTPSLQRADSRGRKYEDMVRETARLMEEAGAGRQPWEQWLEYFRSKNVRRLRPTLDGRWFEWSEKVTPSGRTVGLRVDVTELKRREEELERARTQYQSLVDSLSDMVYALDARGVVTFASAASTSLLGVAPPDLIGRRLADFVAPEDAGRQADAARIYLQSKDDMVRQIELRMRCTDGTVRHMEFRYRQPPGGLTRDTASVGVMRDVSERVELSEQLRQRIVEVEAARADYQSLLDSLTDVVLKIDAESGIIKFASANVEEIMGSPVDKVVGSNVLDHIITDDLEALIFNLIQVLRGPSNEVKQLQHRVRNGRREERHVEARFRKMPRAADGTKQVVVVVRDIEERIRLEQRLASEMTRLRSIVESSGALILLADRELNVAMVNSEFTAVTGIAEEDALGKPMKKVIDCPIESRTIDAWFRAPLEGHRAAPVRYTNHLVDLQGRRRLISVTATPVVDQRGRVSNIVFLGVDDTERAEAEQALFHIERLSTVGEMAATMAHEINQPLQVINLAAESAKDELAEGADPKFIEARLERIGQQVDRASRIVGELRGFVRGTGSDEPERPFEAAEAVRAAIELMAMSLQRHGTIVALSRIEPVAPVTGHVGKLEQVLVNLFNNARDAGARSIEVSVTALGSDGPRPSVCIVVDDDGPGIPVEVLPRLFVDFVTTKERGKGTGFGLRICRRIIEEMGGTIAARNRTRGGARFEIVLPTTAEWIAAPLESGGQKG